MATASDSDPEAIRRRILELLEEANYQLSRAAISDAEKDLLPKLGKKPSQSEIIDYVIEALSESRVVLRCAPQGNPPGSGGIAWQLTDRQGIFIKLQIREIRFGQEYVFVQSCHLSKHM